MLRRRLPLLPPRIIPWPLKSLASAVTSLRYDEFGRMVMHIRHDLLKGLSPRMVVWWFRNIGGDMSVEGRRLNRYLVWHPHDHIRWELLRPGPDRRASLGAKFRIVEAFGRNLDHYVDVVDTVTRLDETGITLLGYKFGHQVSRLDHDFMAVGKDTQYVSTLRIGVAWPFGGKVINPLIHRVFFPGAMGFAWLRHNVEEVGLLEHIVPQIFSDDSRTDGTRVDIVA